ncbi:phosphoribosylamine--glycine ligase [Thermodesulfovibrio thiophilus]|uniref:phosphoribosylamine--glycine ligase n=1 Tax=Thermodesulfovibrio thiophilus TaxID=340095 RepID=UPI0004002504|nr:phosphoribosylamine--glycine ligase [Thermodesulfovibrio thiophilus]HHW21187.1 phosphoribosylamine--glycine ligase [Thermodesulfovibrio thiophilus]
MKVLVIGSGGREHAIIWKLSQSRVVDRIYCAPGNAGISEISECIEVESKNLSTFVDFVKYEWIDLTVVGPEEPLAKGIVDLFLKEGRKIIGPTKAGAQIEGSKVFAKEFMKRYKIPTANYQVFNSYTYAEEYIRLKGAPIVIKADGLAAGKGVFIAKTHDEAMDALKLIMKEKVFGPAGDRVVIEECLQGQEVSYLVFTDGKTIIPMVTSKDHKRLLDNDEGPNTGGMGTFSPNPIITPELEKEILETVIQPTIMGLRAEGIIYKGILYAGLMIVNGKPYVLEFNCRFGDPETQVILPRLETDIIDIFMSISEQRLSKVNVKWKDEASLCVILASHGYPGTYKKGIPISGLEMVKRLKDVMVFHSGTGFDEEGKIVTNGGRVLGITALGQDLKDARNKVYSAIELIHFDGMQYRKDIGLTV